MWYSKSRGVRVEGLGLWVNSAEERGSRREGVKGM